MFNVTPNCTPVLMCASMNIYRTNTVQSNNSRWKQTDCFIINVY